MRPIGSDDANLIARLRQGDEAAIEILYERYGGACFALAYRIIDDRGLAEDVVQQAFLDLWRSDGYDPHLGGVRAWLMTITHHKAVDALRREAPRRRLTSEQALVDMADPHEGTDEVAWQRLRAAHTREALRNLSAELREVLLLAYFGGYTQSEIAQLSGIPLGTVKSRTRAALQQMRQALATPVDPPDDVEGGRP